MDYSLKNPSGRQKRLIDGFEAVLIAEYELAGNLITNDIRADISFADEELT